MQELFIETEFLVAQRLFIATEFFICAEILYCYSLATKLTVYGNLYDRFIFVQSSYAKLRLGPFTAQQIKTLDL